MQFRPWEVCSLDDLWSFAASHSLKHFINRCTWKSPQYYIAISRMTSFIRTSQKLVFHQSKCICAIKRILSTTAMYTSSSSFMCLRISCYCDACLNSSDLRVGVTTLLNTIQLVWNENFSKIISSSGWAQSCTSNLKCPKTFLTYDVTYKKGKIQNQKNCIIADLKTCQVFSGFDIFSGLNKLLP